MRAVASLSNVELITALLSCTRQPALVAFRSALSTGWFLASLLTEVHNKALAVYLSEQGTASGSLDLTTATLEVLACIAFKQPISQAEIDILFDADKRGLVVKLRDLKLVEEFAGADGRLRFATTPSIFTALRARKFAGIDRKPPLSGPFLPPQNRLSKAHNKSGYSRASKGRGWGQPRKTSVGERQEVGGPAARTASVKASVPPDAD